MSSDTRDGCGCTSVSTRHPPNESTHDLTSGGVCTADLFLSSECFARITDTNGSTELCNGSELRAATLL